MEKEKFNGNRLKTARLYRAKTLAELAKEIDVSKQAISQYENSEVTPEYNKLFKIMQSLNFPLDYFYQTDDNKIETTATYFRSLLRTHKKDRIAQIKQSEYIGLLYDFLSQYIRFPKLNIPQLDISLIDVNFITHNDTYEVITQALRDHWGLGSEPVQDIVYELERNGIILTSLNSTTNDIDAYSQRLKTNNVDKFLIVLSSNKESKVRRQFDCAHELGHIIMHNWNEDLETISRSEFTSIEMQANKFAAAFLLPKETFSKDILRHPVSLEYYKELKLKWHVSIGAMLLRARDLDVINYNQYQNLYRKYSSQGWKTNEPLDEVLKISNPSLLKSATKKLIEGKNWNGDTFSKMFAEKYSISLNKSELEVLLNLEKGFLSNKDEKIIDIRLLQ